jgi:hypothetical protein
MTEPRDHAARRNWLEAVLRYVPGFHGYLEKEYRRESDALTRQHLADRLQRSKRGLDDAARRSTDAGRLDLLPQIERFRVRLDTLVGRVRGAMPGYSGFFDLVRIDEARLEQVYEHDYGLFGLSDQLDQAIQRLAAAGDALPTELAACQAKLDALQRAWDVRNDMLRGWDAAKPVSR